MHYILTGVGISAVAYISKAIRSLSTLLLVENVTLLHWTDP